MRTFFIEDLTAFVTPLSYSVSRKQLTGCFTWEINYKFNTVGFEPGLLIITERLRLEKLLKLLKTTHFKVVDKREIVYRQALLRFVYATAWSKGEPTMKRTCTSPNSIIQAWRGPI